MWGMLLQNDWVSISYPYALTAKKRQVEKPVCNRDPVSPTVFAWTRQVFLDDPDEDPDGAVAMLNAIQDEAEQFWTWK